MLAPEHAYAPEPGAATVSRLRGMFRDIFKAPPVEESTVLGRAVDAAAERLRETEAVLAAGHADHASRTRAAIAELLANMDSKDSARAS